MDDLISIAEYAALHGKESSTIRAKCIRGGYQSARKIGCQWVISASEPHTDHRDKGGEYKDWRKLHPPRVYTKQELRIKELKAKEERRMVNIKATTKK